MLRILIADDEEYIRKGMIKIIGKLEIDCQIVGEASNGVEALEMVEQFKPNLVISDIKMPKMDGIGLMEKLHQRYPKIRKVVLSGFKEFDFVHQSLKYAVVEYLLKPIDKNQLYEILKAIENEIKEESNKRTNDLDMRIKLNESFPLLKDQFLNDLVVLGKFCKNDLKAKLKYYNVELQKGKYHVIIISIDNIKSMFVKIGVEDTKINSYILRNISDETVAEYATSYFMFENELGLVIVCILSETDRLINHICAEIYKNLLNFTNIRFTISIGKNVDNFEIIKDSYEDAAEKIKQRFYNESSTIIIDRNRGFNITNLGILPDMIKKMATRLANSINNREDRDLIIVIIEIANFIKKENYEPRIAINIFTEVIIQLEIEVEYFKDAVVETYGRGYSYFKSIDIFDTMDEIVNYTSEFLSQVMFKLNIIAVKREEKAIELVKDYINKHYREDIKLQQVANMVYMNANYFSGFFKKHTGENFLDYLTKIRIGKAKELLKDIGVKTYEVGIFVGYEDPAYFNRVFRKVVGISPGEYKKLLD